MMRVRSRGGGSVRNRKSILRGDAWEMNDEFYHSGQILQVRMTRHGLFSNRDRQLLTLMNFRGGDVAFVDEAE